MLNLRIPGQLFASHGTTMYYASLNDEIQQTHSMTRLFVVIWAFSRFEISYASGYATWHWSWKSLILRDIPLES